MHKNRTQKGIELQKKHDERYKKMLIGKISFGKLVTDSEWIGNSVYGIVRVTFEDGETKLVSSPNSFRPKKEDFHLE